MLPQNFIINSKTLQRRICQSLKGMIIESCLPLILVLTSLMIILIVSFLFLMYLKPQKEDYKIIGYYTGKIIIGIGLIMIATLTNENREQYEV